MKQQQEEQQCLTNICVDFLLRLAYDCILSVNGGCMAGKQIKTLSKAQALKAKEMYAELDGRGRRVWSMRRLADYLEVSETTIFRAVNSSGSYKDVPELLPPEGSEEMKRLGAESLARLQTLLAEEVKTGPTDAEVYLETGLLKKSAPVNPLDE
jgi:hypothetical protein